MTWQHNIIFFAAILALLTGCSPAATQPKAPGITAQAPPASVPLAVQPKEGAQMPPVTAVPVPPEYQALYDSLSEKLDKFDRSLDANCKPGQQKLIYAAELLSANSNMGEGMLTEANYRGIIVYLDALQAMGVTGVKIAIDYPSFMPDFPNNDAYIKFYKKLMQELRSRKLTVFIANGNLFQNSPFSDLKYSFNGLTLDKYRQGKRQTCETIIRELHPDYLTVVNEPNGAESLNTGLNQTPVQFAETTRFILNGLEHSGTLLGSGTGTWSDINYIRELVKIPELDYVDMHIYPVDYLQGALEAAAVARGNNKRLVLAEVGLYKVKEIELGNLNSMAAQASVYGRDIFSFWEPLDSKFLEIVIRLARCNGYEFISPFWSTCLFSYIDYNALTKNLNYNQLRQSDNAAAFKNMVAGKLSGWGETYKKLISSN